MGASRAPTMVMAYLIARRKISLLDSYRYIQSLRSVVQPNAHFLFQLAQLEVRFSIFSSFCCVLIAHFAAPTGNGILCDLPKGMEAV